MGRKIEEDKEQQQNSSKGTASSGFQIVEDKQQEAQRNNKISNQGHFIWGQFGEL